MGETNLSEDPIQRSIPVAMAVKTLILATEKYNFDDFGPQTKKTSCLIWWPKNKAMRWENVLKTLRSVWKLLIILPPGQK